MLGVYADFAESWIALPVVKGYKSPAERFAGAEETYCIESMLQDGKALQSGTSHFLGQNFAKAFDVKFVNKENELEYAWATSWGVSTRLMGALIMAHSDDNGLVLPPKLAPIQVVIVPIHRSPEDLAEISAVVAVAREHVDAMAVRVQARHQPAADEAGTTEDDDLERFHGKASSEPMRPLEPFVARGGSPGRTRAAARRHPPVACAGGGAAGASATPAGQATFLRCASPFGGW